MSEKRYNLNTGKVEIVCWNCGVSRAGGFECGACGFRIDERPKEKYLKTSPGSFLIGFYVAVLTAPVVLIFSNFLAKKIGIEN